METPASQPPPRSPWQRFGWLMGVIWLVFLIFPLISAITAPVHPIWRVVAVAAVLTFGVLYAYGFIRMMRTDGSDYRRTATKFLLAMVATFVVAGFIAGVDSLGMTVFLLTFGVFHQPLRRGLVLALGWIALTVLVLAITGSFASHGFLLAILVGVGVMTSIVRWLDDRQGAHDRLATELNLVAERERVARDVHDVLGHSLTVITVKSELAERLVDADPEAAKAELAQIRSMTRESLAEIRATVAGLRVARLGDELDHARAALQDAGIHADVPDEVDVVDPRHRLVLGWVLREAVTNVVRHSRATRCTVQLGSASLVVIDDGVGPGHAVASPSGGLSWPRRSGTGLTGVAERVRGAGGTLSITAAEGSGTRLEVHW